MNLLDAFTLRAGWAARSESWCL